MPNTHQPLPIQCPKCDHSGGRLVVKSATVMTVTCDGCGHFWAIPFELLPPEIQDKVFDALRELL